MNWTITLSETFIPPSVKDYHRSITHHLHAIFLSSDVIYFYFIQKDNRLDELFDFF